MTLHHTKPCFGRRSHRLSQTVSAGAVTPSAVAVPAACWVRLGVVLLLSAFGAVGCKSTSLSTYVAPRVVGRTVNVETRQPVEDVKVRRVTSDESYRPLDPPKGGQVMERTPAVRSGKDGRFDLDSVRALAPFARDGWYSVTIRFEHPDYGWCDIGYTLANATNTPAGEPLVNAGDILLIPRAK